MVAISIFGVFASVGAIALLVVVVSSHLILGFAASDRVKTIRTPGDSNLHLQEGQVQLLAVAIWGNLVGYESRSLMLSFVFVPFLGREDVFGALLRNPSLRYLKILTSLSALSNM